MKPLFFTAALFLLAPSANAQYIYTPSYQHGVFNYQPLYAPPVWAAGPVYWSPYGVERELRYIRWALEDQALRSEWQGRRRYADPAAAHALWLSRPTIESGSLHAGRRRGSQR